MENGNSQTPEQKLEVLDVAEPPALGNNRPKGQRGRPPGSGTRKNLLPNLGYTREEAPELVGSAVGVRGAGAERINGRQTRVGRTNRGAPLRVNSDKPIFTLSVAAEILALHPRTLRIYEEHGLVIPHRTQTQRRRYSQNDIKKFQFIQFLTQTRRVNLEGVKIILFMLDELKRLGESNPTKLIFPDYSEAE